MSELVDDGLWTLSGAQLLELAVDKLLTEVPAELPEQVALDRARTLLVCSERLTAARLAAVADVDRRELFALDCAGSTRGWLRVQPGGESGQLMMARRLGQRPLVDDGVRTGQISVRAAEQLCAVLDKVPGQVEDDLLRGVVLDGVGALLQTFTGGLVPDAEVTADLLAARAEADCVLQACAEDSTDGPAQRLEPALVLLASRLTASHLGPALRELLEALMPDGADGLDRDPYFFELRELLDGDVEVRGHLCPEVGHGLAAEIARRVALAAAVATKVARASGFEVSPAATDGRAAEVGADSATEARVALAVEAEDLHPSRSHGSADPFAAWDEALAAQDQALAADTDMADVGAEDGHEPQDPLEAWDAAMDGRLVGPTPPQPPTAWPEHTQEPGRPLSAGRLRHDALGQLLHDLTVVEPGSGRPRRPHLTIIATLAALEGRLGALPARLVTTGQPAVLTTAQLRRLACHSDLDAVLLDAIGNPVGASHTRRNLTPRERRALRAQWGSACAVAGCPNTVTVPHHVEPFWLTGHTRLRDIVPACEHCHHDLHDGHRTLRLRDGRLINELGWVAAAAA